MTRKKALIILAVLVVGAAVVAANFYFGRQKGTSVNTEALRDRDLEAIVSASGTVQPKRQVNISANTMGRVTRLAVHEGERVKAGQFLLEIDPKSLSGQLERGQASVAAARSSLDQSQTGLAQAKANLDLAQQNLKRQQELWSQGLTTRETLEQAQNNLAVRQADLTSRQQEIQMRQEQIKQEQASLDTTKYNLTQVIIQSPMDGIVTRRNIEEGETAVVGTMNNAGTVLLTIADMSELQAEVEVDETDIPNVEIGQQAKVTIDAVHVHRPAAGDDVQSGRDARRTSARHPSGIHVQRRDHDGEPHTRGGRADPGADRARDAVRREGHPRPRAATPAEARHRQQRGTDGPGRRAAAGSHAQGNGRRVRGTGRAGRVHAGQGRDCG